jgi:hypothetical protein
VKTLVLTLAYPARASYYDDWADAFRSSPIFRSTVVNILDAGERRRVGRIIDAYDLTVVLHACTADSMSYAKPLAGPLQGRRGRLVAFVGNELNLPWAPLGEKIDWLRAVRPDIVATQLLPEAGEWLYADRGARVLALPHALNPRVFRPGPPSEERPIDIGARSFRYLAYLGDDDRNRIFDFFAANPFEPKLVLDFSTEHRFDRRGWAEFLARCKATIATEAGSWYLERDDATVRAIRRYAGQRMRRPLTISADSRLRQIARRFPEGVRTMVRHALQRGPIRYEAFDAEELDFADVHGRFFAGRPRAPVYGKCISSRHFEAVGTRTLQIMFPGRYNDILEPGRHYVELAPDFSNAAECVALLRDPAARDRITEAALEHVLARHTYAHRLETLAQALG